MTKINTNQIQTNSENLFINEIEKKNIVYHYPSMSNLKLDTNWVGKICKTSGFWFEGDGGGGLYILDSRANLAIEDPDYFLPYWGDADAELSPALSGGAGLYHRISQSNIFAKYIGSETSHNLSFFGVKYDANYINSQDLKYYSDSTFTTLATDNFQQVMGAIWQTQWWSKGKISRNLILSKILVINQTINLTHGAYGFSLRGNGHADNSAITSNVALDALIENYYDDDNLGSLTGNSYVIEDISFLGNYRVKNGLVVKNGSETDGINRLQFHQFVNAALVLYGTSSTFKFDTISCFANKYGVLITSNHPYNETTSYSDGLMSLYKLSGDNNTDSLLAIDCVSDGASINVQSIKSELNNNCTVHIINSSEAMYISLKNAFTNGNGDFLKIENYIGQLPTIELEGIFHNDADLNDYDINDLKNNKQIRFFKNPTAAFPHIIYTNNAVQYEHGFLLYQNGKLSSVGVNNTTTIALNSTTLNSTYPDAAIGFKVYCTSIIAGAMTYEKTPTGWLGFTCLIP